MVSNYFSKEAANYDAGDNSSERIFFYLLPGVVFRASGVVSRGGIIGDIFDFMVLRWNDFYHDMIMITFWKVAVICFI